MQNAPTKEYLEELVSYNPITGDYEYRRVE